ACAPPPMRLPPPRPPPHQSAPAPQKEKHPPKILAPQNPSAMGFLVPAPAVNRIVARPAFQPIVAAATVHGVVASKAEYVIAGVRADEGVVVEGKVELLDARIGIARCCAGIQMIVEQIKSDAARHVEILD